MNQIMFDFDRAELGKAVKLLSTALAQRPRLKGLPFYDVSAAIAVTDDYFIALRSVSCRHTRLCGTDLLTLIQDMVTGYHNLWTSPFPPGLEAGQALFSAILERPMRDLLHMLIALQENIVIDYAQPLVLDAPEEIRCFMQWAQEQQLSTPLRNLSGTKGLGYGSLVASFLLGWWFGHR